MFRASPASPASEVRESAFGGVRRAAAAMIEACWLGFGVVVPDGDVAALADTLVELLHDPAKRKTMGAAGRRRAEAQFGAERVARDFERVLEDVLAGKGRS